MQECAIKSTFFKENVHRYLKKNSELVFYKNFWWVVGQQKCSLPIHSALPPLQIRPFCGIYIRSQPCFCYFTDVTSVSYQIFFPLNNFQFPLDGFIVTSHVYVSKRRAARRGIKYKCIFYHNFQILFSKL